MAGSLRWTAWNLTAKGWLRGHTIEGPVDADGERPIGTLLALVSVFDEDDPSRTSQLCVLYRDDNTAALAAALSEFGSKLADVDFPRFAFGDDTPRRSNGVWWHLTRTGWQMGVSSDAPDAMHIARPEGAMFSVLTFRPTGEPPAPPDLDVKIKLGKRAKTIKRERSKG